MKLLLSQKSTFPIPAPHFVCRDVVFVRVGAREHAPRGGFQPPGEGDSAQSGASRVRDGCGDDRKRLGPESVRRG